MQRTFGVTDDKDLEPGLIERDTRPLRFKIHDFVSAYGGFVLIILGLAITLLPMSQLPQISDVLFVLGMAFWLYCRGKNKGYQFRSPIKVGPNGKHVEDGLFFIGRDRSSNAGVWFSNDDLRTHCLVFGSTGSGKTRMLLGILYQAMMVGSGCLYVDGKGDNTVWWLVYSLCRRLGREDDLLVLNYLTGSDESSEKDQKQGSVLGRLERKSNTNNPFAHGSGEQLRSLIVGLMRDGGGDDMWKGRASAMLGGLLKALTHMRDKGEINLDVETVRDYLPLDRIVELAQRTDIKDSALAAIKKYLGELPGYSEEDAIMGQIQSKAYEQHGYLTMQLTEVMADMSDTYGHIFSSPLGEIDYKDVVFNRRILFVILPSLEKDPDALAGLGKLVVAGVRSALAPALGDKLEGTKREVIDQKPTTSSVPFVMILDEYGYYSVKGFAVVAAQARSLGVSVIFAGQDYPSFKKGSEEEAKSTVANTNIKICMKLEDPTETYEIMEKRAGEADTSVTSGSEMKENGLGGYSDQKSTRIEKKKRINLRDLVKQKPGEAHIMFGDELCRARVFYADPTQVLEASINKFVMVDYAKKGVIDKISGSFEKLDKMFNEPKTKGSEKESEVISDEGIKSLFNDFLWAKKRQENTTDASIFATALMEVRDKYKDVEIQDKAGMIESEETEIASPDESNRNIESNDNKTSVDLEKTDLGDNLPPGLDVSDVTEEKNDSVLDAEEEAVLGILDDGQAPEVSVRNQAKSIADDFERILTNSVLSNLEKNNDGKPLSAQEKIDAQPVNALAALEKISGKDDAAATESAKESLEILSKKSTYPGEPTPQKEEKEKLASRLAMLIEKVETSGDESFQ